MDIVFIEQLRVDTVIGVYDWEKTIKQTLLFDLKMEWDNRLPAQSDDVNDCLNYATISQAITDYVATRQFSLIERVAEEVAQLLLSQFMLTVVTVTVYKPGAVTNALRVGVSIIRSRQ